MSPPRESLKNDLLSLVSAFNCGEETKPGFLLINDLVEALAPLSPIQDPTNHLPAVLGSWSSLYAAFGVGHSKGKSHNDDSLLSLQSFKTFPDIPIHIDDILQEIGDTPNQYNNVVFFRAMDKKSEGTIIIHGTYECDLENSKRFRVIFYSAEIRGRNETSDADLRKALGLPDDYALKRDFKPAKLYSDVVYLDETTRINIGGMGGVYVLQRRQEPAVTL